MLQVLDCLRVFGSILAKTIIVVFTTQRSAVDIVSATFRG